MEFRSKTLKDEIKILKVKEKSPEYNLALNTLIIKNTQAIPSSLKIINGKKAIKPSFKSYAQITAANVVQNPLEKAWTEVTSSNYKQKGILSNIPKIESEKRQVIFWKEATFSHKSKTDLMLILNELMQKVRILAYIRFSQAGYS